MKQKKSKTFQIRKKKRFMMILLNQQKPLIKKKNINIYCDDLDYYGIRDIENLFDNVIMIMLIIITNQHQSKVLLKIITFIINVEVIKKKTIGKEISLLDYAIFKWFNK